MAAKAKQLEIPVNRTFTLLGKDDALAETLIKAGWKRMLSFDPDNVDLVIFTGTRLVHPFLIGEKSVMGDMSEYDVRRDRIETKFYKRLPAKVKKLGINRGAILLNILSGGSMYQIADEHELSGRMTHLLHSRVNFVKEKFHVRSTHKQQMIPSAMGDVIAYANESKRRITDNGEHIPDRNEGTFDDPEVVHYWHSDTLCCQFPVDDQLPTPKDYLIHLIDSHLFY